MCSSDLAGGVPVLSEETAVEEAAQIMGIDPAEELRRMHEEKERNMALQAKQFGLGGDGGELGEDAEDEEAGKDKPQDEAPPADDEEDEGEDE